MTIDVRRRLRPRIVVLGAVVVVGIAGSTWVATPAVASAPQSWVALGDSYTAGAIQAAGDEFEYPRDGCVRTDHSYPEVIKRDLGSLVELTNVSCGNATVSSITEPQTPIGHHFPPLSNDPDYPFEEVAPQLDAVRSTTDVVTVGIGGNTLGFGQLMTDCVALGGEADGDGTPCENEFGESIQARLDNLSGEYDAMLSAIHNKAPVARVITVGYPHIVPENVALCRYNNLQDFYTITPGDLTWLRREVLEGLNRVIEHVSNEYGDRFVDLYPSTAGHSVCDKAGGNNWVDGLFTSILPPRAALVHPNAKGHANAARLVEEAILS